MEHLLSLMKDKNLNYDYKGALMLNYGYKEELMLYYAELLNSFIVLIKDKHEKIECILNKRKLDSVFNHNPDDLSMKNSSEN